MIGIEFKVIGFAHRQFDGGNGLGGELHWKISSAGKAMGMATLAAVDHLCPP
jgi:hypothetical protein